MVSTDLLKNYSFFKGFTDEELKKFAEIASEESYKAGVPDMEKGRARRKSIPVERRKGSHDNGYLCGTYQAANAGDRGYCHKR